MPYRWQLVLYILSAIPLAEFATPLAPRWGDIRLKHTWNTVPDNWESLGPPPSGTAIDLYIALKPHRESALIDALYEVSNPRHQKYGAHLSKKEVAELVTPHQDTFELVHSWLEHHGVPSSSISRSHGGSWLTVTGVPVSQADRLLCASYHVYKHTGTNETETIIRTVSYALPEALHSLLETVAPTTYFASPPTIMQEPKRRSSEETAMIVNSTSGQPVKVLLRQDEPTVTPGFIRWLYRTFNYVPEAGFHNALGILGLHNDYPNEEDLTDFMLDYREDAVDATFQVVPVNGGTYNPTEPGTVESSVDIQYTSALAYPTPQIFYPTGGNLRYWPKNGLPTAEDVYLAWLKYLLDLEYIPPTISISYANPETSVPGAYATAVCNIFAQLGLRGVSVLIATGDHGVGLRDCRDDAGNVRFYTMFPASCPWVTSVGGTMRPVGDIPDEVAMPLSGGGFSQYFGRPNYQKGAVLTYLQNFGNHYAGLYNAEGRAVPDVASLAHRFEFILNGEHYFGSGTSCATPTFAGIVSLLNDYLISTDRRPLGFLNLWLYDRGILGLNDIMSGNNPGCQTPGFAAIVGWDPVTGLGSPNFELLQLVVDRLIL
ncbi:subtilisin-like protein [Lactarius quietus]|nr:subtilisin-like protein [Lactarius quietus]